jgi:hypothetical protein
MSDVAIYTIYSLKDKGEIIYIGSTKNPLNRRLNEHRYEKKLKKHITIEKICEAVGEKNAKNKEYHMINLIGRNRLINYNYGRVRKDLTSVVKIRKKRNKFKTEEDRINFCNKLRGIKKKEGLINKRLVDMGFREFDLYKDGNLIGRFVNQTHAASAIGFKKSTFVDILKGKRIKTKGIEVRYV